MPLSPFVLIIFSLSSCLPPPQRTNSKATEDINHDTPRSLDSLPVNSSTDQHQIEKIKQNQSILKKGEATTAKKINKNSPNQPSSPIEPSISSKLSNKSFEEQNIIFTDIKTESQNLSTSPQPTPSIPNPPTEQSSDSQLYESPEPLQTPIPITEPDQTQKNYTALLSLNEKEITDGTNIESQLAQADRFDFAADVNFERLLEEGYSEHLHYNSLKKDKNFSIPFQATQYDASQDKIQSYFTKGTWRHSLNSVEKVYEYLNLQNPPAQEIRFFSDDEMNLIRARKSSLGIEAAILKAIEILKIKYPEITSDENKDNYALSQECRDANFSAMICKVCQNKTKTNDCDFINSKTRDAYNLGRGLFIIAKDGLFVERMFYDFSFNSVGRAKTIDSQTKKISFAMSGDKYIMWHGGYLWQINELGKIIETIRDYYKLTKDEYFAQRYLFYLKSFADHSGPKNNNTPHTWRNSMHINRLPWLLRSYLRVFMHSEYFNPADKDKRLRRHVFVLNLIINHALQTKNKTFKEGFYDFDSLENFYFLNNQAGVRLSKTFDAARLMPFFPSLAKELKDIATIGLDTFLAKNCWRTKDCRNDTSVHYHYHNSTTFIEYLFPNSEASKAERMTHLNNYWQRRDLGHFNHKGQALYKNTDLISLAEQWHFPVSSFDLYKKMLMMATWPLSYLMPNRTFVKIGESFVPEKQTKAKLIDSCQKLDNPHFLEILKDSNLDEERQLYEGYQEICYFAGESQNTPIRQERVFVNPHTGIASYRNGIWKDQTYLLFNAMPGPDSHRHLDPLNFEFYQYGINMIADNGIYHQTHLGEDLRNKGMLQSQHSTLVINDKNANIFHQDKIKLKAFSFADDYIGIAEGQHSGYSNDGDFNPQSKWMQQFINFEEAMHGHLNPHQKKQIFHKRILVHSIYKRNNPSQMPPYLIVYDKVYGDNKGQTVNAKQFFHLHPVYTITPLQNSLRIFSQHSGANLIIENINPTSDGIASNTEIESFTYHNKRLRDALYYERNALLPFTLISIIIPLRANENQSQFSIEKNPLHFKSWYSADVAKHISGNIHSVQIESTQHQKIDYFIRCLTNLCTARDSNFDYGIIRFAINGSGGRNKLFERWFLEHQGD